VTTSPSISRVVFMGTPDFAVPSLQELIAAPRLAVVGVVTQPDRPAGRGRHVRLSPVKQVALDAGLPIIQPASLRKEPEAVQQLRDWSPDFLAVAAFGQILRPEVLDIPRIAPINVHASLLPRWRGAAPIHAAIRAGDRHTGITIMVMDPGLDTGPIVLQDSVTIRPDDTGQSLHDRLARMGARLLALALECLHDGRIAPHPQPDDENLVTYAPTLQKEQGHIDWTQTAVEIDRHVRAFDPWPGTYAVWNDKRLGIKAGLPLSDGPLLQPGRVGDLTSWPGAPHPVGIGTGAGVFVPLQLQLEGRKTVALDQFLHGAPDFAGSLLE
jgi:methionyl-tRNA formyltransferase